MRVFLLISLTSCAGLSPSVKQQLRASTSLEVVRAPTPMVLISAETGKRISRFQQAMQWRNFEKVVEVNVTSRGSGGADPAELLRLAVAQRLKELGYAPKSSASALVRFESTPERWPKESGVTAEWVLHAQVDAVGLDADEAPRDLRATATLFHDDAVELRTRCSVHADWQDGEAVTLKMLERCATEVLTQFEN